MPRISPETAKPAVVTGEDASAPAPTPETVAAPVVAERPFLVYVTDGAGGGDYDKAEKVVLQDERVAYGARAFTAVRMSPEEVAGDPLLAKAGKELPRFLVVSADFKNVAVFERDRLSASTLWTSMKTTCDRFYAKSVEGAVKGMKDLVLELDKIEGERKQLGEKLDRLAPKGSDAERKAVEAKIADLDARMQKAREKEAELFLLAPKGA